MRRRILAMAVALTLGWVGAVEAKKNRRAQRRSPDALTNVLLRPELAQWLVGPIERLATSDEIDAYLRLTDDEAAAAFIEDFWERRGPHRQFPPAGIRFPFEERMERADDLYGEGPVPGHRTDRGVLFVLYGPPAETTFAADRRPGAEPIEIWHYPSDSGVGLDGSEPQRRYAFQRNDGLTHLVPVPPVGRRLPGPTN